MNKRLVVALVAFIMVALCFGACAPKKEDSLRAGFVKPPESARPWVYWFWLNSNITREGITADLEAMKRVGIGGVLIMEVDQGAPVGKAAFMGTEWRELFKHAVAEAGRLGLEINMNDDAGWNGSGGPWITPEQSMQKVVWTETCRGPRFEEPGAAPGVAGFYRISVWHSHLPLPDPRATASRSSRRSGPQARKPAPSDRKRRVADISAGWMPDRKLKCAPGKWTIVRFGHTSTGVQAPAGRT
jgi:hypothetical protein